MIALVRGAYRQLLDSYLTDSRQPWDSVVSKLTTSLNSNRPRHGEFSKRRNELLGIFPLLGGRFGERGNACNDPGNHEDQGDEGPNDTPALRRAAISLGKHTRIRRIDFSEDEIIALESRVSRGRRHNEVKGGGRTISQTL